MKFININRIFICNEDCTICTSLDTNPAGIRKVIYTTNSVEALHRQFRKVTKTKGSFTTDDALKKMLYLAMLDLKGGFRSKQDRSQILV
ncbi:MAG: transposase [Proteobacteria bacterium]|nr:MAG: transposase [Pseudomonadota bacterium]